MVEFLSPPVLSSPHGILPHHMHVVIVQKALVGAPEVAMAPVTQSNCRPAEFTPAQPVAVTRPSPAPRHQNLTRRSPPRSIAIPALNSCAPPQFFLPPPDVITAQPCWLVCSPEAGGAAGAVRHEIREHRRTGRLLGC